MIYIIHGEDTASSRNHLLELRTKLGNPVIFDAKTLTLTQLVQEFEGGGLFSIEKTIIIENLLVSKNSVLKDELVDYIKKQSEHETVLWEEKEMSAKELSAFKSATIIPFKFPQLLFQFLDNLKPNNAATLISLFRKIKEKTSEELVLFMIIRQFRILLALSNESDFNIEELNRLPSWQKGKLTRQARLFSEDKLKEIFNALFQIELKHKTGRLSQPLTEIIDFFLLDI